MILQVSNLRKAFRQGESEILVLRDLNLSVASGETVAILGESGSGKSTLLALLAGLDFATSGSIQIGGTDLSTLDESALSEFRARSLGIVFQQYHLMSTLTALENVALPLELRNVSDPFKKAETALEEVGLSDRFGHYPHQLSGGECQRVALARALVVQPALILADEPSGSLDQDTGDRVMGLLFDLVREKNSTLILVTHSEKMTERCDRCLVLKDGRLYDQRE